MHGGVKFYNGDPSGARAYLEADHCRADDYYLAEGSGLAAHYTTTPGLGASGVVRQDDLDAPNYERWVHGYDATTGQAKGVISQSPKALRFVEVTINGPKTWSLAAALHPEIATAYDAAQERAAVEIIGRLNEHSTTRVGPEGRQVQVPIEHGLEAVTVRHYTSRAGDPHRHLHLQINAKVYAEGKWRALHSVGTRDSIDAINGIGHAAVMCDPEFRAVLAAHGYTLDAAGEIEQLAPYAGRFSQRAKQIERNVDRYEAEWRAGHPDQEPGPRLRRAWDRRAWADARPDKVVPKDGADLVAAWNEELRDLGFRAPSPASADSDLKELKTLKGRPPTVGAINRDVAVDLILTRLASMKSAWNAADIRGQAEQLVASVGVITERSARVELTEDLTARAVTLCEPLLARPDVPEHVRHLTSRRILAVEAELTNCLAARAESSIDHLDPAQQQVVAALAGHTDRRGGLLLIEGAAGTGKTTTLAAASAALDADQRRLVVVTPTLKAAQAAQAQIGADAFSAAWLIHQHGYR